MRLLRFTRAMAWALLGLLVAWPLSRIGLRLRLEWPIRFHLWIFCQQLRGLGYSEAAIAAKLEHLVAREKWRVSRL